MTVPCAETGKARERSFSGDGKSRVSMNMNVQLEMSSGHERRGAEREPCEGVVTYVSGV